MQEGISQRDIGAILSLSKQTVNSSTKCLANMELIELKESIEDKRVKTIALTKKGEMFCADKIDKMIHNNVDSRKRQISQ